MALAPVPLLPSTTFELIGVGPNTVARVYSETGFRGTRTQYGKAGTTAATVLSKFVDYTGVPGYPRSRSRSLVLVLETGTPSTSTTTLISTNGCNGCNLQGVNLSGYDLSGASVNDAELSGA